MSLNDLLLECFVIIKIIPFGYGHCQFVQLLQIPDAMWISFGVTALIFLNSAMLLPLSLTDEAQLKS